MAEWEEEAKTKRLVLSQKVATTEINPTSYAGVLFWGKRKSWPGRRGRARGVPVKRVPVKKESEKGGRARLRGLEDKIRLNFCKGHKQSAKLFIQVLDGCGVDVLRREVPHTAEIASFRWDGKHPTKGGETTMTGVLALCFLLLMAAEPQGDISLMASYHPLHSVWQVQREMKDK